MVLSKLKSFSNSQSSKYSIVLVITLLLGCYLQGQVLWYGNPDLDVKSSFRRFDSGNAGDSCSNQSDDNSFVSTTNDPEYGKVWTIRKPKGQKRGEFARTTGTVNNYEPKDGDIVYYGWRWKIESTPNVNNGIAVWQWKTDAGDQNNTQNYPLNMGYGNGELTFSAWGPCYPTWNSCSGSISRRKTTLWSKSIPENTWVSFVVGIKMSRDYNVGYVELWYNGEKQTLSNSGFQDYMVTIASDGKRAFHKTFDGKVVYPKWGSYNANACNFNTTTYYDEMRVATNLASALPSGSDSEENQLPSISFDAPSDDTTVQQGYENLLVTINATDPDGSIDNVKLYIDGNLIRQENVAPYEWGHGDFANELLGLSVGEHVIMAEAKDNRNGVSRTSIQLIVEEEVLSIDEFDPNKLKVNVYPNPAIDKVFISETSFTASYTQVTINDLKGKTVKKMASRSRLIEMDISDLSSGFYLITIKGDKLNSTKLFIKK